MIIEATAIEGVFIIKPRKREDERGFFAKIFDNYGQFFTTDGTPVQMPSITSFKMVQASIANNHKEGTLRGMHYQDPFPERKIIQCVKGSVTAQFLDMRVDSPTYKEWRGIALTDENNYLLFLPERVAFGYQTLKNDIVVMYWMDEYYHPEAERTVSYKSRDMHWPRDITVISKRDQEASIV